MCLACACSTAKFIEVKSTDFCTLIRSDVSGIGQFISQQWRQWYAGMPTPSMFYFADCALACSGRVSGRSALVPPYLTEFHQCRYISMQTTVITTRVQIFGVLRRYSLIHIWFLNRNIILGHADWLSTRKLYCPVTFLSFSSQPGTKVSESKQHGWGSREKGGKCTARMKTAGKSKKNSNPRLLVNRVLLK